MKKLLYALSVVFLSTAVSHGGTKVHTDYDREMSFSEMTSYAWTQSAGAVEPGHAFLSPLLEKRIQDAVDQTLASKGIQHGSIEEADFQVSYHVIIREEADVSPIARHYSYGYYGYRRHSHSSFRRPYYGGYGYGGYSNPYSGYVDHYLEVTLVIDVHDLRTGELVWRGWAIKDMARQPDPDDVAKYARNAVRKMFKKFPPEGPKG